MMAPAIGEQLQEDWLRTRLPNDGSVSVKNITQEFGTLVIAGPNARKVLSKITDHDVSHAAFPWFSGQEITVAGVPLRALRMNFVGELGWELHHPIDQQQTLYDALHEAGKEFGIRDFGLRAMDSMRIEKGYPMWGTDLITEYTVLESNLGWFVKFDHNFEGREALETQKEAGLTYQMVVLEIHDSEVDAASGMEPVYFDGQVIGQVSSGCYGHRTQKSLAIAYIEIAKHDMTIKDGLTVKVLGQHYPATVTSGCVYDPKGICLKSAD